MGDNVKQATREPAGTAPSSGLRFTGRVVIVTGAGRGIGRAHALAFARRGAMVVVNDVGAEPDGRGANADCAREVVAQIQASGGQAVASHVSVATGMAGEIIDLALARFGRIDALINNAGIQLRQSIETLEPEDFARHVEVHLGGTYRLCRAAWPHLAKTRGRIVNTLSALLFGMAGYGAYAAAKGGIFGLTRTLAVEGRAHGIMVNGVVPGAATRLMVAGVPAAAAAQLARQFPAETVAEVVAFLAHESCALQGECISVAGQHISRYVLAETAGATLDEVTAETVLAAMPAILALEKLSIWTDTAAAAAGNAAGSSLQDLPQTRS